MARVAVVLVFSLLLAAGPMSGPVCSQEMVTGEITRVDRSSRTIWLRLERGDEAKGRVVRVILPVKSLPGAGRGQRAKAADLAVGQRILVRGASRDAAGSVVVAEEIRSCAITAHGDPTGVRLRLFRYRQGGECRW
ncbi:MAG: hypothetical protein ACK5PS_11750 [Desulfopila sp.]